jgi:membrane protein DedA with SNARE-associated domain
MSLEQIVSTYGYVALLIGTFLEGETILILGGVAANQNYLYLPWVITCAFVGTLFGDQLYYFIGRIKGISFLERRPHWQAKAEHVFKLLRKHQLILILGFRFMYGFRTITPFLIGTSGIPPLRFIILNIAGAFIWSVVFGLLGYLFGHTIEIIIGDIKRYESLLFLFFLIAGSGIWYIKRRSKQNNK